MNHMGKIAHMMGVELGEEFNIKCGDGFLNYFKYKFTEEGLMRYREISERWDFAIYETFLNLLSGKYRVVVLSKQPLPILTEQERNYLSSVVRPFREKILHISKLSSKDGESICIDIRYDWEEDSIMLPKFAAGTLYKGMEIGKEYSIKELSL